MNHSLSDAVTLTANLGIGYDTLNEQAAISANFVGGGATFVTRGMEPDALLITGGIGVVSTTQSGMEITAKYDVETRQDFTNQTASVKLRWPF